MKRVKEVKIQILEMENHLQKMLKQIMDSEVDEDNLERLLEDYKDENIEINYGEL